MHWTQTKEGRAKLSNGMKEYWKNKNKEKMVFTDLMTLTIYHNEDGHTEISTYKIKNYGEMIDILYNKYAGVVIYEVRCV